MSYYISAKPCVTLALDDFLSKNQFKCLCVCLSSKLHHTASANVAWWWC